MKSKFFILCGVIFLVRLQGSFESERIKEELEVQKSTCRYRN